MARPPRIVAELGRPETPDETAARKAESSRVHRESQNTRNLVAALLVTLAIVAVIIIAVPRGSAPEREPIDVAAVAAGHSAAEGRTLLVPVVPDTWTVNSAAVTSDVVREWTVVYVPSEENGFLRVTQGFDADAAWPTRVLAGADLGETVTIDGIEWQRYDIDDPARAGNVTGALSTSAGADTVLVFGTSDDEALETAAAGVADQIRDLRREAQ